MNDLRPLLLATFVCSCSGVPASPPAHGSDSAEGAARAERRVGLSVPPETLVLPNGMTVVLLEDHALPKVVIDTWFSVGSKDEAPGRSGFAHLFEHLMFMGTARVPANQFDVLMERGGGQNNASTSSDLTNYFSMGPSALLPTLLWLDADRLEALAANMTQEKLDRQREIVRNERRQSVENVPYGKVELILPEALYPPDHPYHHPVIGSHEDLEAATLEDVVQFFREFYVPANATLVVAGDFDPAAVKPLIERTFGALAPAPAPEHRRAAPVVLEHDVRLVDGDEVEFPKLFLTWHSPAGYEPGDAELDLLATILAEGPSSRLEKRLVLDTRLAQEVAASQQSGELGSLFQIEALAAPGTDLDTLEREVRAVLAELLRDGPTEAELARAKARQEARFLRRMEGLLARAEAVQAYRRSFGVSDGFQRDLERWTKATAADVAGIARTVLAAHAVDLRIVPHLELEAGTLEQRPADFARSPFQPAAPRSLHLANGIAVHLLPRPGTGLFTGSLLVPGGEFTVPKEHAGAAELAARWIESGAGGRDKAAFAEAFESLGASLGASAGRSEMVFECSGLTSRLDETLDLLTDLVRAPNLTEADFAREQELLLNEIRARDDDPSGVARNVSRALLFGAESPRGRPVEGSLASVGGLTSAAVKQHLATLLVPARASFVFAGDLDETRLRAELEARFGKWSAAAPQVLAPPAPLVAPPAGRIVFVQREGAPQTVIQILRPVPPAEGLERARRAAVNTVFGGTFTSRLNANLREDKGYSYGARSSIGQEGPQFLLNAGAAVVTEHTGDSLVEFKKEFERMMREGLTAEELEKAVESNRQRLVETAETTTALARSLSELVRNGRALDALTKDMAAIDQVDLAGANAIAQSRLFAWDDCLVVLVGDREAITTQLAAAGFPAPTEVDAEGRGLE